jgi:transposase
VGLQTVRDWVLRFNAEGPEGLLTGEAPGARALLSPEQRQALERVIEEGPIPAAHGVVRWRLVDLVQWVWDEFRITISSQTMGRELRSLSYRKLSARPRHHAKNEGKVTSFKKTSQPVWRRSRQVRRAASP